MNELGKILSTDDLHNFKNSSVCMERYVKEVLLPLKDMLSNDWRKARDLLSKISNDQRRIDLTIHETEKIVTQLNTVLGIIK